jgi:hypothetical protein
VGATEDRLDVVEASRVECVQQVGLNGEGSLVSPSEVIAKREAGNGAGLDPVGIQVAAAFRPWLSRLRSEAAVTGVSPAEGRSSKRAARTKALASKTAFEEKTWVQPRL